MKIKILAIGKLSSRSPEKIIIDEYLKRLQNSIEIKELEHKNTQSIKNTKEKEGELFLLESKGYYNIVLDQEGLELDSIQFANMISKLKSQNITKIAFIIGGAFGICEKVKSQSDFKLSLGKMTLPHMLARIIITEQIYRSLTINKNHPYHK
ncbi:MAG: 23S rRNA (pseudouridine(1915)-N(3))-methyltransferase RlmH [Rickettsiales bacterium]|nr:MAG: 23S rRNA (pseudouridine(1915)-N(3))-methyltransferase RlmH [Rickettsiales bacterium]